MEVYHQPEPVSYEPVDHINGEGIQVSPFYDAPQVATPPPPFSELVSRGVLEGNFPIAKDEPSELAEDTVARRSRRKVWLIVGAVCLAVIIVAAVGGGVGGALAANKKNKSNKADIVLVHTLPSCMWYIKTEFSGNLHSLWQAQYQAQHQNHQ